MKEFGRAAAARQAAFICLFGLILGGAALGQQPRGVYLYSWDIAMNSDPPAPGCPTKCTAAQSLVNALAVNGIDGLSW